MKKNCIIAAIAVASALLFTVSCQKEAQLETKSEDKAFTAVIDQNITKTTITNDYNVNWESGDKININGAVYSATPDGTDATKASFTYVSGTTPEASYTAIYPASLYNEGSFIFPSIQTYESGKFNAPMYAKSETESLEFKNICGVICFSLKGTAKVKSIAITANEALCGSFSIVGDGTTVYLTGTGKTVSLDCGTGVQLDESTTTNFYVYLPPKTYSAGMKFVITNTEGWIYAKTTTSEVSISRKELYTLSWTPEFTPASAPESALSGKFSVAADKQVFFSKGNLQAKYDGSKYNWGFAANQSVCIGKNSGNISIDDPTNGAVVDLFGWSTTTTTFGINTSAEPSDYSGDFVDWGKTIDNKGTWRTLSTDEWVWLLKDRPSANSMMGSATVCGVTGFIILPDVFTDPMKNNGNSAFIPMPSENWTQNVYTVGDNWNAMEAAGAVFLPAAGLRRGATIRDLDVGTGVYWSSSFYSATAANGMWFSYASCKPDYEGMGRNFGMAVRLVTDVK